MLWCGLHRCLVPTVPAAEPVGATSIAQREQRFLSQVLPCLAPDNGKSQSFEATRPQVQYLLRPRVQTIIVMGMSEGIISGAWPTIPH
jgi:hypothetical protein